MKEAPISKSMTLNVRITGELSEFVADNVGEYGLYENVSEYVRDLIRRDRERIEAEKFVRLKAELQRAFAQPDSSYSSFTYKDLLARHAQTRAG